MSLKINNDTANGSVTLKAPNVAGDYTVTTPAFSTELAPRMQLMTVQNSTSGTSIDFTGIPSWVKKITVMFNGVSTSGTSALLVQIGDSGGVENSGYIGNVWSGAGVGQHSIGFVVQNNMIALQTQQGNVRINLFNGNTFIEDGNVGPNLQANAMAVSCGSKALSATLDRIRVTTVNGTDLFDDGQINIMYEG